MATRARAAQGALTGRMGIIAFSTPLLIAVIAGGLGVMVGGVAGGLHLPWAADPLTKPLSKPCPIYCGPDDNELVGPDCVPPPTCGNKICEIGENVSSCSQDCSLACGDGVCNVFENAATCQADCTSCGDGFCGVTENTWGCLPDCPALSYGTGKTCGNGYCEPWHGEDPTSCSKDCLKSICGDGVCTEWDLDCAADCAPTCGDHVCGPGESSFNCVYDCCDTCGNGFCSLFEKAESCPADCSVCGNGVCSFGESPSTCPKDCHPVYYIAKWFPPPWFGPLATIPGAGIVVIIGIVAGSGVALIGRKKRPPHRQTIHWLVGLTLPLGAIGLVLLAVNATGAPLIPPEPADIEPIDVTSYVVVPPGCHCEGTGLVCPDFRLCKLPTPSGTPPPKTTPSYVPLESDFTAATGPDCKCVGASLVCASAPVCGAPPRITPSATVVTKVPGTALPGKSAPETSAPVETQQTEPYCKDGTLYLPGQPPAECNPECMNCRCENGQRVCDFCGNDGVSCEEQQPQQPECGNGVVEAGESCDPPDGQTCNRRCQLRATPNPNQQPTCGDGIINQRGEECDPPDGVTCNSFCHRMVR